MRRFTMLYYLDLDIVALNIDKCVCTAPDTAHCSALLRPPFLAVWAFAFVCRRIIYHSRGWRILPFRICIYNKKLLSPNIHFACKYFSSHFICIFCCIFFVCLLYHRFCSDRRHNSNSKIVARSAQSPRRWMNFIWISEYQNISWFLIWFDSRPAWPGLVWPHGILIDPTHESMAATTRSWK